MKPLLLLAALAACAAPAHAAAPSYDHLKPGVPVINHLNAGDPDAEGWCHARSKFGNYTVDLPGKYLDTMLKISGKKGGFAIMHRLMTRTPSGGQVDVSLVELHGKGLPPGSAFETIVKKNRDRGTLARRDTVKVAGRQADHLAIATEQQLGNIYRIKAPNAEFLIILQYPKAASDEFTAIRARVLKSFRMPPAHAQKR